jgi:DNA adenine methylase
MMRFTFARYIEPFGGGAAVLFAKPPSKCEIYNDIYSDLVTFYKVLRDPNLYQQLIRLIECTPYSREVYNDARRALADGTSSDVERAWYFFTCVRQSFSSLMKNWSTPTELCNVVATTTYWRAIYKLPEVHERLKNVHIENMDAIECIKKYANDNSLIYCDPPYIHSTRVSKNDYKHEYTDDQHRELVEALLSVPGHKILSGYESPIYEPLLDAGWELITKQVCCHASGNSKKTYRTECLYVSPIKCKPIIRSKTMGKHPLDRKVFFVQQRNDFLSYKNIHHLAQTGKLSVKFHRQVGQRSPSVLTSSAILLALFIL